MMRPLRSTLASLVPLLAVACSSAGGGGSGGGGDATGGAGGAAAGGAGGAAAGAGGTAGAGGALGGAGGASGGAGGAYPTAETLDLATLSGDVVWTVTFDDAAKAAGAIDCSYTRHYEAVEDRSAPWFCPSCEIVFRADVEMTQGQADCFSQISTNAPLAREWLGYGAGTWFRGVGGPMTAQGTVALDMGTASVVNQVLGLEANAGGTFQFDVAGSLTQGTTTGDPMNGFTPPATSACGWPKANPPPYEGDWTVAVGAPMPDGWFLDACGEPVRLHDFQGSYLLVDMSALDCPACQTMADAEPAFAADMAAQGVDVHVVTLMAPSLADTIGDTSQAELQGWIDYFSLESPVLADRGWGLSMFMPVFGETVGYPSWVLVSPSLEILAVDSGFPGFAGIEDAILADALP